MYACMHAKLLSTCTVHKKGFVNYFYFLEKIWRTIMAPIEGHLKSYYHNVEMAIENLSNKSVKQSAKIEPVA
jgi:hypothetical protein